MAKRKRMGAGMTALLVVVLVVGVGAFAYFGVGQNISGTSANVDASKCGDSTGILTVSARSALVGGVDPSSPTVTAGINGGVLTTSVTSGTTAFAVGDEIEVLVSKADYIDESYRFTMPCGGYTLDAPMFYATSDNPTITIKDDDANTLSDAIAGGSANLSDVSVGSSAKFDVFLEGTNGEATGDMIYVMELPAGSSANVSDVSMGTLSKVEVPSVYTSQNAGSEVVAFAIPSIEGAVEESYRVIVTLNSGKDLSGGVYTDLFAGQEFIDDDKTLASGVEDASGDATYENSEDYDFLIN